MSLHLRRLIVIGLALTCIVFSGQFAAAQLITSVTATNSDAAITNTGGVVAQRENTIGGTTVLFGEDVFTYIDRTHQYNGTRFTAAGVLTATNPPAVDDITIGLPAYLIGGEYVSTLNGNRDNATFQLQVDIGATPVTAYLLLDNRLGGTATDPPTLGSGGTGLMSWVADDGWVIKNTGVSPNGQPDFAAIDEGNTITDFATRATNTGNLGTGAGVLINNFFSIYEKSFPANSTILLKEQNGGGINMYGLVVQPVPEPSTIALVGTAVVGVAVMALRRRKRIA
jgi:hypothetical protein